MEFEFPDPVTFAYIFSAVTGILTIIIFLLYRAFTAKRDTIFIVGLSDSGKTTIFTQLTNKNVNYDNTPRTYSSMAANEIQLNIKGKVRKIVDYPGNDRLRRKLIEHLNGAAILKIVFVIDAATFSKMARDVAELVYDVLLESAKDTPILLACHKQDHSLAKTAKVIQNSLEKEIGLINKSRSAALIGTDGSDTRRETLTDTGVDFKWDDLKKRNIQFDLTSSRSEDFGIETITNFVKN